MNKWRWDHPRAFEDGVNHSNLQTTNSGKVKRTGENFSWYGSNDVRAKIEPPRCRQYRAGEFLAGTPLNWDKIIDNDDDDDNSANPRARSDGRSRSHNDNGIDDGDGEEDTQGREQGTGKEKGIFDRKGKGKGKGEAKGNSKGKGIVQHTPGGDDISRAVALKLQKEIYKVDSEMEGKLEQVYLDPDESPAVSIFTDDDTNSTESYAEYATEHDPDVDMCMEDDVDAPDGVDLDSDVDIEKDGDDEEEEDEEEKDEEEEDGEEQNWEENEEDKDEEQDKDEDDGKEPRTIGHRELVNTSGDDGDTIINDQTILLPEQGQEMRGHTPPPQHLAPAHGHKHLSLSYDHELRKLIPSVG